MNNISPAAEAAREHARNKSNGQFGNQQHSTPDTGSVQLPPLTEREIEIREALLESSLDAYYRDGVAYTLDARGDDLFTVGNGYAEFFDDNESAESIVWNDPRWCFSLEEAQNVFAQETAMMDRVLAERLQRNSPHRT